MHARARDAIVTIQLDLGQKQRKSCAPKSPTRSRVGRCQAGRRKKRSGRRKRVKHPVALLAAREGGTHTHTKKLEITCPLVRQASPEPSTRVITHT